MRKIPRRLALLDRLYLETVSNRVCLDEHTDGRNVVLEHVNRKLCSTAFDTQYTCDRLYMDKDSMLSQGQVSGGRCGSGPERGIRGLWWERNKNR